MKRSSSDGAMKRVGENLWLRHGRYYARLKKGGKDIWRSLKTQDRNIAKSKLESLRHSVAASTIGATKEDVPTFAEAVKETISVCERDGARPKSLLSIKTHLGIAARSSLATLKISAIRTDQLKEYLRQRFAERTGRTANLDLIQMRKVFRLSIERSWRWDDPTQNINLFPHKEKHVPVPSLDEIKAVLQAMRDGRMRQESRKAADFIELLALSGLRLAEAQSLAWEDVNSDKGTLTVREGKGGKSRVVDLFPSLRAFVDRLLDGKEKPVCPIFPGRGNQPYNPKCALETACKIAVVPRFSFHGLRHAWATELVKAGIDFGTIAKWAGHNDGGLLIAKRYGNHMRRDHMQMAAQKASFSLD